MKKLFVLLPLALMLSACGGEESKIKNVVQQNLKDPSSVQFKDVVISENGWRACIIWNAKNSMGGYGDWNVAELRKIGSEWTAHEMNGSSSNCSESAFKAIDAGEKAEIDAKEKAIELLQKAKNISSEEASKLATGVCNAAVYNFVFYSKELAKAQIIQDTGMIQMVEKQLSSVQTKLEKGECEGVVMGLEAEAAAVPVAAEETPKK
jgi:hypothetical protein